MKSKMMRIKPEELSAMKFKEAKMILKKDLETLQTVGTEGTSFFVSTEFDFEDEKGTVMLTVGEIKGEWKKYVKTHVKPPHKGTAMGTALMDAEGTTLTLNIEKGKGKPKEIEKALKKAKLIPSSISNVVFNETPKLDADDEIDAVDEEVVPTEGSTADEEFKKVVAEAKIYKTIAADDSKARLAKIKDIDKLIADWEKKNMPVKGNATKEERNATLQKLRTQLYGHRIDINVQSRSGAEPIDAISTKWTNYKKRPTVAGTEALADMEDRVDTVADLREEIVGWLERNQAPYSKKEQELKNALDVIIGELNTEEQRLASALPAARKAHVKAMVEKLTKATPEEKEALKKDELFMWELSRVVPVAQINDARKLLGLEPVANDAELPKPVAENAEAWKDPEILSVFKDFAKFTTFEVAIDHKADPKLVKTIKLLKGTWIWEEGQTAAQKFQLNVDTVFSLMSEDGTGNLRLELNTDPKSYYYCVKTDVASETHYEKLPAATALFPETPSKNHILQGGLGDCYLLAAITSLAAKDPNAIVDMMLDKGDTVTVRLFDVKINATTGKKTFTAKYFNIDKSVVKQYDNTDGYTHTYLWVQMLEKAYAAGGFTGSFTDYQAGVNATGDFAKIDGGHIAFSIEVLTGKEATVTGYIIGSPKDMAVTGIPVTERGKHDGNSVNVEYLPWGTDEATVMAAPGPNYTGSISYEIFGKDKAKTIKWWKFVQTGSIDKLFAREYDGDYNGEPTLDDFEQLFKGKMKDAKDEEVTGLAVLEAGLATTMLDWLKAKKIYPGKRGSGVYTTLQLSLFQDVKDGLASGKLVGLGSKKLVGRGTEGVGHSGGEAISGGLVGGHAYTVLDTREPDPLKELEIRNPWGSTVQRNVTVADRIVEIEKALKDTIAKIVDPIKKELSELKTLIEDIRPKFEKETDKDKKKVLKDQYDIWATRYKELITKRDEFADLSDLSLLKDKVGAAKENYEKGLTAIVALKKKDPTEMISTEEQNLQGQEGGEFWLYLDDLTRRFSSVHVG